MSTSDASTEAFPVKTAALLLLESTTTGPLARIEPLPVRFKARDALLSKTRTENPIDASCALEQSLELPELDPDEELPELEVVEPDEEVPELEVPDPDVEVPLPEDEVPEVDVDPVSVLVLPELDATTVPVSDVDPPAAGDGEGLEDATDPEEELVLPEEDVVVPEEDPEVPLEVPDVDPLEGAGEGDEETTVVPLEEEEEVPPEVETVPVSPLVVDPLPALTLPESTVDPPEDAGEGEGLEEATVVPDEVLVLPEDVVEPDVLVEDPLALGDGLGEEEATVVEEELVLPAVGSTEGEGAAIVPVSLPVVVVPPLMVPESVAPAMREPTSPAGFSREHATRTKIIKVK